MAYRKLPNIGAGPDSRAKIQDSPGYSIKVPKSGSKVTADGFVESEVFQVNIDDRKAYTISFYHTTSRITVNGQKMQRAFIEEDYPTILEHLSGLTSTRTRMVGKPSNVQIKYMVREVYPCARRFDAVNISESRGLFYWGGGLFY